MSTLIETSEQMRSKEQLVKFLHLSCRLILAATIGISSIQKMVSPISFENVLTAYHLDSVIVHIAVPFIPLLEFVLALTLLLDMIMRTSTLVATVMLGMYMVLMGVSLITCNVNRGCGCFFGISNSHSWAAYLLGGISISIADVVRDVILMLIALAVWFTRNPSLGFDKFWTNSPAYWRWYRGRGYMTGAIIMVLVVSSVLAVVTEWDINRAANAPLSIAQDFNPDAKIKVDQKPPGFTLASVNGTKYSLDAYRGKVVLLEFFAVWYSNCQAEARPPGG